MEYVAWSSARDARCTHRVRKERKAQPPRAALDLDMMLSLAHEAFCEADARVLSERGSAEQRGETWWSDAWSAEGVGGGLTDEEDSLRCGLSRRTLRVYTL